MCLLQPCDLCINELAEAENFYRSYMNCLLPGFSTWIPIYFSGSENSYLSIKQYFINQEQIIRWLLDHNPSKRPSSKELLASELLPRPHSETEYSEMVLRSTVANPSSSSYRHLLHAIFNQSHSIRQDLFYDHEMYEVCGISAVCTFKLFEALRRNFETSVCISLF